MTVSHDPIPSHCLTRPLRRAVILLFLGALLLPSLRMAVGSSGALARGENRPMAAPPRIGTLRSRPGLFLYQLKAFIQDNFGFRAELVRLHAVLALRVLGSSPSSSVVVGREGWLFQRSESVLDDYRRVRPFTDAELDAWASALEARRAWLAERGIAYFFVVGPNTHTIYAEFLPDWVRVTGPRSRLDQLLARLRETTGVEAIDVRAALRAAKGSDRLYHRTDTHWNERGAFVAYGAIAGAIARRVPGFAPLERSMMRATREVVDGGDLAGSLGLADRLREEWLRLRPVSPGASLTPSWERQALQVRVISAPTRVAEGPAGPRAVIFHDSFGVALTPLLAEGFSHVRFEWINEGFDPAIVESERPAVVVQEITERYLMHAPPPALARTAPGRGGG